MLLAGTDTVLHVDQEIAQPCHVPTFEFVDASDIGSDVCN